MFDDRFQATDCLLGEEGIPWSSSFLMLVMSKSGKCRGSISERFVCESILIPAAVVAVQRVVEIRVIDMDLIRADTDEGTCINSRMSSRRILDELMRRWAKTWVSCHMSDAAQTP